MRGFSGSASARKIWQLQLKLLCDIGNVTVVNIACNYFRLGLP